MMMTQGVVNRMTAKRNKINGLKRQIGSIVGLLSGQSFLVIYHSQKLMETIT